MIDNYRAVLGTDSKTISESDGRFCHFSDDLSITYEKNNEGVIFDKKLSGSVTFYDRAFELLKEEFDKKVSGYFYFTLKDSRDGSDMFYGKFTLKDCEINFDDKLFTASITDASSKYPELKAAMNKDVNICSIGAPVRMIGLRYYDVTQVTMQGSRNALNIVNGQVYRTEITSAQDASLINERINGFSKVNMSENAWSLSRWQYSRGDYFEQSDDVIVSRSDSRYMVRFNNSNVWESGRYHTTITATYMITYSPTPMTNTLTKEYYAASASTWKDHAADFFLTPIASVTNLYKRTLTRAARYSNSRVRIEDDVDSESRFNYHNPGGCNVNVYVSARFSTSPSDYGINADGKYYLPPNDDENWISFCEDRWTDTVSYWVKHEPNMGLSGYEQVNVHAYDIKEVLEKLLRQLGLSLELDSYLTAFSAGDFYLVPNSNILRFPYSRPASICITTLKKLLATICSVFNMDYYLREDKLVLCSKRMTQHSIYRHQKPTYAECQIDCTELWDNGAKKLLGTGQNTVKLDTDFKLSYSFSYTSAEEGFNAFDKAQMVCSDVMAQDGASETVDFGCDADINKMMIMPQEFSDTDFAIICCSNDAVAVRDGIQNGIMAVDRVAYYYQNLLPNQNYVMRGVAFTAKSIKAYHELNYKIPLEKAEIDIYSGIYTQFGACQIEKVSINLTTFVADITLKF